MFPYLLIIWHTSTRQQTPQCTSKLSGSYASNINFADALTETQTHDCSSPPPIDPGAGKIQTCGHLLWCSTLPLSYGVTTQSMRYYINYTYMYGMSAKNCTNLSIS